MEDFLWRRSEKKPIKFIPPANAVRESLDEARRDVDTLEYLLTVAEEVERRQSPPRKTEEVVTQ